MLYGLPTRLPTNPTSGPEIEAWKDVTGRAVYARGLILDDGGQLDAMMNISYGDGSGVDRAEFGDEILQAARAVMESE